MISRSVGESIYFLEDRFFVDRFLVDRFLVDRFLEDRFLERFRRERLRVRLPPSLMKLPSASTPYFSFSTNPCIYILPC